MTDKPRFIEVAFPLKQASLDSMREKNVRHGHITHTIQVLNAGVWQTRDGKEIRRLPSRHEISDSTVKAKLRDVERSLGKLRAAFDDMARKVGIRPCGCSQPDCPVFHVPARAGKILTKLRTAVLISFSEAYLGFQMPDSESW